MKRYFGTDVHDTFLQVYVVNEDGEVEGESRVEREPDALLEWAQGLTRQDSVLMEASGSVWVLYDLLVQYAGNVVVGDPKKMKVIAETAFKTDRRDAKWMAILLRAGLVAQVMVPCERERYLRGVVGQRVGRVQSATESKNRIRSYLKGWGHQPPKGLFTEAGARWMDELTLTPDQRWMLTRERAQLAFLEGETEAFDQKLCEEAVMDEAALRLMMVAGINGVNAMTIMAQIGSIGRFGGPKHLSAYAGLAPRVSQSGGHRVYGRLAPGRKLLRWALIEAANTAVKHDAKLGAFYEKLKAKKCHAKAIAAAARKLAVIIWHILHENAIYQGLDREMLWNKLTVLATKAQVRTRGERPQDFKKRIYQLITGEEWRGVAGALEVEAAAPAA